MPPNCQRRRSCSRARDGHLLPIYMQIASLAQLPLLLERASGVGRA